MDQVRILREARGWTQQHLADATGLSLRTIQRTESGEVVPSKETLLALSGAFDVRLDADDGPHVALTFPVEFLPGCKLTVIKDNFQVPCVIRIDSRSRTATRYGLVLLDVPEDEFNDRVRVVDSEQIADRKLLVDGEPWDGREEERHVTVVYDAVILRGPDEVLWAARADGKVPRHWVLTPTTPEP